MSAEHDLVDEWAVGEEPTAVTYLLGTERDRLADVVEAARSQAEPILLVQGGAPVAAVLGIKEFQRLRQLVELVEDYQEIIAGLEGPGVPDEEVWRDIEARLGRPIPKVSDDVVTAAS